MVLDISAHVRNRAFSASASSYPLNVGPSQSLFTRASKFRDFCNTTQLAIKINHLDEGRITLVEGYIDDLIEEDWSYLDNKPKLQKEVFTALSDVRNTFRTTTDRNARLKMLDKLDNLLERACPEPESPSSSSSLEGRKVFVVVERNGEYFDETGKNITW